MKTYRRFWVSQVLLASVPGAVLTTAAHAADSSGVDPAVAELTCPRSTVDLGAGYVSQSSAKFGQYNGLAKSGAFALGDVDLRGTQMGKLLRHWLEEFADLADDPAMKELQDPPEFFEDER